MSAKGLSNFTKYRILFHLKVLEDTVRKDMEKEKTAMEITPELLKKNFSTIKTKKQASILFEKIVAVVKKNSEDVKLSTRVYTPKQNEWKNGVRYIKRGEKLILVAQNYIVLRKFLTNRISNDDTLKKNIHVGMETYEGVNSEGKTVIKQRSKFDIGHTVGFGHEERNAVAAARTYKALDFVKAVSPESINHIQKEFLGKFKSLHVKYNIDFEKEVSLAKDLVEGKLSFVYTIPQASSINKSLGTGEKNMLNEFRDYIINGDGSKPLKQMFFDQMKAIFFGNKPKIEKTKASVAGKTKGFTPKINIMTRAGTKPEQLRNARGQFTSVAHLTTLLQPLVTKLVRADMDKAWYFKTDTDNFTKSVTIKSVDRSGSGGINVNYDYEDSRYGSFEHGGKHNKPGREPSTIINRAIRVAAIELVHNKFQVNPVGGTF